MEKEEVEIENRKPKTLSSRQIPAVNFKKKKKNVIRSLLPGGDVFSRGGNRWER